MKREWDSETIGMILLGILFMLPVLTMCIVEIIKACKGVPG